MALFGLTGCPASGKSLVADLLHKHGAHIFDADKCVHRLYADTTSRVYKNIVKKFPECVKAGQICRKKLGAVVFGSGEKLKILEKIVHPAVIDELKAWAKSAKKDKSEVYIAEVQLLFEKKLENIFDAVIVIAVKREIAIKRLCEKRKLTKEEAVRRLGMFMPVEEKLSRAGYVVYNNTTKQKLKKEIDLLWKHLST